MRCETLGTESAATPRGPPRANVATVDATPCRTLLGGPLASALKRAGTSSPTPRLWDRGEVIGAAVLALAGIAWFGWGQADPPSAWVPYLATGSVVSALLLVALVVVLLLRRLTTTGSPMADRRVRRGYWVTVMVEIVLIVGGNLLLTAIGHPAYDAAWTLFVVGVHFVPLARIFHSRWASPHRCGGRSRRGGCGMSRVRRRPGAERGGRRRWRGRFPRVRRLGARGRAPDPVGEVTLKHARGRLTGSPSACEILDWSQVHLATVGSVVDRRADRGWPCSGTRLLDNGRSEIHRLVDDGATGEVEDRCGHCASVRRGQEGSRVGDLVQSREAS